MVRVSKQWFDELVKRLEVENGYSTRLSTSRKNHDADEEKRIKSLDSALKKTTAFMKKLKTMTAPSIPSIIDDLQKINLTKFVEEIAKTISETKFKASELMGMVSLCVAVAEKYPSFGSCLFEELKKSLPQKKTDKIENASKLQLELTFFTELILCGVCPEKEHAKILGRTLSILLLTDKKEYNNASLLSQIIRSVGWQLGDICSASASEKDSVEIESDSLPKSIVLSSDYKKTIRDLFTGYHDELTADLAEACKERNAIMKKVKKQQKVRGDAAPDVKESMEAAQKKFDRLKSLCIELGFALDIKIKELKEELSDDESDEETANEMGKALAEGKIQLWLDEETQDFYEDILDLRSTVPQCFYEESLESTLERVTITAEDESNASSEPKKKTLERKTSDHADDAPSDMSLKNKWEKFNMDLDHMVTKELVNEAAIFFVKNINVKSYRKKLVKVLRSKMRLDLPPFIARLVVILQAVMPDLATEFVNSYLQDFKDFMKNSEEQLGTKTATVLMICELIKFGLVPRNEGLNCLRMLVYDLRGHCVDLTATMLESAGLFLYRNTDTHPKMKRLVEVIKTKRDKMKDPRQQLLIDNAYFKCLPPDDQEKVEELERRKREAEDPMPTYIKTLIMSCNESNADVHLKCLRRLDWANPTIRSFTVRLLSSPWLVPVEYLPTLVSCIAGLSSFPMFEWLATDVVDNILEHIQLSLECPGEFNQWALASALALVELHNYELVDFELVSQVLYCLITYPEEEQSTDLHRVRMVCSILNTISDCMQQDQIDNKLVYFLQYFYRYYLRKKQVWIEYTLKSFEKKPDLEDLTEEMKLNLAESKFPYEVDTAYNEVITTYRPFLNSYRKVPSTYEDSCKYVENMERKLEEKSGVKRAATQERQSTSPTGRGLNSIDEGDEMDDERNDEGQNPMQDAAAYEEEQRRREQLEEEALQAEEDAEFERELTLLMAPSTMAASTNETLLIPGETKADIEKISLQSYKMFKKEDFPSLTGSSKISLKLNETVTDNEDESESDEASNVILLTKDSGKHVLKPVSINDDKLHEAWHRQQIEDEKNRRELKRITLEQTARYELEELLEEPKEKKEKPKKLNTKLKAKKVDF